MALRLKTLGLYRQLLRNSKNLPISLEVKRKMIYNVHEIFRIRMRAPPTKVPEYHKNAEFALEIMNKMNLVPEKYWFELFEERRLSRPAPQESTTANTTSKTSKSKGEQKTGQTIKQKPQEDQPQEEEPQSKRTKVKTKSARNQEQPQIIEHFD